MATIDPPGPGQVLDRVNLTPASFGAAKTEDASFVYRMMASAQIIEAASGEVEDRVDEAVKPHDFPLPDAIIVEAQPTWSADKRQEWTAQKVARLQGAIIDLAASKLLLMVRTSANNTGEDTYQSKSERLRADAERTLSGEKGDGGVLGDLRRMVSETAAATRDQVRSPRGGAVTLVPQF